MTQPQKDRIFKLIVSRLGSKEDVFQLRVMFEHEIHGMDADKDEPCSLDHTLYDKDYLSLFYADKRKRISAPSHTFEIIDKNNPFLRDMPPGPKEMKNLNNLSTSIKSSIKKEKKDSTGKNGKPESRISKHMRKIS